MKQILLVGVGGFTGSILRYLVYLWIDKRWDTVFPFATFTVNIVGSLLLGFILGLFIKSNLSDEMRLLFGVGICGSFTTFSTFAMENVTLLEQKDLTSTISYLIASVVIGILVALAGYWLGKSI